MLTESIEALTNNETILNKKFDLNFAKSNLKHTTEYFKN